MGTCLVNHLYYCDWQKFKVFLEKGYTFWPINLSLSSHQNNATQHYVHSSPNESNLIVSALVQVAASGQLRPVRRPAAGQLHGVHLPGRRLRSDFHRQLHGGLRCVSPQFTLLDR